MRIFRHDLSPEQVARITGGELILKNQAVLNRISDPRQADDHSVIFQDNEKFLSLVAGSQAGLIIAGNAFREQLKDHGANLIFTDKAYQAIMVLADWWLESEKADFTTAVHPTAELGQGVSLPEHIRIGAFAVIGDNVILGDYTIVESFCQVGNGTRTGTGCHLYPHVTIYPDTELGDNVYIHAGCVIGADGFGYMLLGGVQKKIPQLGQVIIHSNVEIGANTTIDRGTIGPTVIGEGTKIDNLVQIGHNCVIGRHSILCAQVGLAGSTVVGDYVYLAGQVGVAGHLTIGDRAMVGAQSGVSNDLEAGGKYFGYPAREAMRMKKIMAVENSLPDMYKAVQKLKKDKQQE